MNNIKETEPNKQNYDEYVINQSLLSNSKVKSLYNTDECELVINSVYLKRGTYECVKYGSYKKK
jgi:hypothetical protein